MQETNTFLKSGKDTQRVFIDVYISETKYSLQGTNFFSLKSTKSSYI